MPVARPLTVTIQKEKEIYIHNPRRVGKHDFSVQVCAETVIGP